MTLQTSQHRPVTASYSRSTQVGGTINATEQTLTCTANAHTDNPKHTHRLADHCNALAAVQA